MKTRGSVWIAVDGGIRGCRHPTDIPPATSGGTVAGLRLLGEVVSHVSGAGGEGLDMNARVESYEGVRELHRPPGALLAEARDASGQPRLLQLARFRGVDSDDDREKRQKQEKVLAQRTADLIGASEVVVHAHGGADGDN